MADLSKRLREPLSLILLVVGATGWVLLLATWINTSTQVGSQRDTISALTAERDRAVSELTEQAETSGALEEVTAQLSRRQEELKTVGAQLESMNAELASRSDEITEAEQKLEADRANASKLSEQVQDSRQQLDALEARRQEIDAQVELTKTQLTDVGSRLEEARALEATTTANVAQFTKEAAGAAADLSRTQTQLQETREKFTAAQSNLADLAAQTQSAENTLIKLQQETDEFQSRRDRLMAEVQSYEGQLDQLQPQVENMTNTLADRSRELAEVEARLAEAVAGSDAGQDWGKFIVTTEGDAKGISLTLDQDGSFVMESSSGGRVVSGLYTQTADELSLTDASGDLGDATFPMVCAISQSSGGFTVGSSETCILSGLTFARSN